MGGAGLVVGLATYGYKIMRVLGVKMVSAALCGGVRRCAPQYFTKGAVEERMSSHRLNSTICPKNSKLSVSLFRFALPCRSSSPTPAASLLRCELGWLQAGWVVAGWVGGWGVLFAAGWEHCAIWTTTRPPNQPVPPPAPLQVLCCHCDHRLPLRPAPGELRCGSSTLHEARGWAQEQQGSIAAFGWPSCCCVAEPLADQACGCTAVFPVQSTTHTLVGAVTGVGLLEGKREWGWEGWQEGQALQANFHLKAYACQQAHCLSLPTWSLKLCLTCPCRRLQRHAAAALLCG